MPRYKPLRHYTEATTKKAPVLNPKQFSRLLFVAGQTRNPERNELIVWLLFAAGLRITEVAQLRVRDVLFKSGAIRTEIVIPAKISKNGKAGHAFFYHPELQIALDRYLSVRVERQLMYAGTNEYRGLKKDSAIVLSEYGLPYALKRKARVTVDGLEVDHWACDTLQEVVSKWGREAGIVGFTTHSGRRTLATRAARNGATEEQLCALLRHTADDQPYSYIDADFAGMRRVLENLYSIEKISEQAA